MIRIPVLALILGGLAFGATESGVVRSGGQPIPGATVTAICGTDKIDTVTDDAGRFTMGGLPESACSFTVSMFGFEPSQRQLTASDAPLNFDLKLQTRATLAQAPVAPSASASFPQYPRNKLPRHRRPKRRAGAWAPAAADLMAAQGAGASAALPDEAVRITPPQMAGAATRGSRILVLCRMAKAAADSGDIAGDTPPDASGSNEAFLVNGSLSQGVQAQAGDNFGLGGPAAFGPGGPGGPAGGANPFGDGADGAPSLAAGPTRRRSGWWRRRWTWRFWRRWRCGAAVAVSVAGVEGEADAARRRIGISSSETGSTAGVADNFRATLTIRSATRFSMRGLIR